MERIRDALLQMVEAALDARKMQKAYAEVGLNDNKLFSIYSNIADAIYKIIGEERDSFENSITFLALNTPYLTVERRTEMLMSAYRRNHLAPHPVTAERKEVKDLYEKNGGYMRETPEGDWS